MAAGTVLAPSPLKDLLARGPTGASGEALPLVAMVGGAVWVCGCGCGCVCLIGCRPIQGTTQYQAPAAGGHGGWGCVGVAVAVCVAVAVAVAVRPWWGAAGSSH